MEYDNINNRLKSRNIINKNIISKSIDDAILKCGKPKWESMHTPKQIARYFGYEYKELDKIPKDSYYHEYYIGKHEEEGDNFKIHYFTDPKNNDCKIMIADSIFNKKNGLLESSLYRDYIEHPEYYDNDETDNLEEGVTYPLKQFFKDYEDLPDNFKNTLSDIMFRGESKYSDDANGRCIPSSDGKCLIVMEYDSILTQGMDDTIDECPRMTLFHEVSHAISHNLGFVNQYDYDFDYNAKFLAETKEYKKARREDKKLNGDKYATDYGRRSKNFNEEQADVCMAMLLKACNDGDENYGNYRMVLASAEDSVLYNPNDYLTIDDFLERYPNRVKALNNYMGLDL